MIDLDISKLTFQERYVYDGLSESMKESLLDFKTDNFAYLDMVRMYLNKIYGDKANWEQLVAQQEYIFRTNCHAITVKLPHLHGACHTVPEGATGIKW